MKGVMLTLLGSIVQKGKFSAGMPIFVSVLNRVLLPTLGKPTMPTCTRMHLLSVMLKAKDALLGNRDLHGASACTQAHLQI